ncbi:hypothetical protein PFISCL1PPCAC_15078, partial [Pristionchus fissidentatus]
FQLDLHLNPFPMSSNDRPISVQPGVNQNGRLTALVTCGSDKVGKEITRHLVKNGYDVIITGKDKQKLEATVEEMNQVESNQNVTPIYFNQRNFNQVQAEMGSLSNNRFNVVVLCASGNHPEGEALSGTADYLDNVHVGFRLNVLCHFLIVRHLFSNIDRIRSTRFVLVAPNPKGYLIDSPLNIPNDVSRFDDFFKEGKDHMKNDGWNNYTRIGLMVIAKYLNKQNIPAVMISPVECVEKVRLPNPLCNMFIQEVSPMKMASTVYDKTLKEGSIVPLPDQNEWLNGENPTSMNFSDNQFDAFITYMNSKTNHYMRNNSARNNS